MDRDVWDELAARIDRTNELLEELVAARHGERPTRYYLKCQCGGRATSHEIVTQPGQAARFGACSECACAEYRPEVTP